MASRRLTGYPLLPALFYVVAGWFTVRLVRHLRL